MQALKKISVARVLVAILAIIGAGPVFAKPILLIVDTHSAYHASNDKVSILGYACDPASWSFYGAGVGKVYSDGSSVSVPSTSSYYDFSGQFIETQSSASWVSHGLNNSPNGTLVLRSTDPLSSVDEGQSEMGTNAACDTGFSHVSSRGANTPVLFFGPQPGAILKHRMKLTFLGTGAVQLHVTALTSILNQFGLSGLPANSQIRVYASRYERDDRHLVATLNADAASDYTHQAPASSASERPDVTHLELEVVGPTYTWAIAGGASLLSIDVIDSID